MESTTAVQQHFFSGGSLVVRASDSRPESLDSIPDATKYPPSTHRARARKISGSESLVGGHSRNHGSRVLENIFLPSSTCLNCGVGDRWCRHLSCRRQSISSSGNFPSLPWGRTRQ
ncbi:hypothetical protein TNCV_3461061 [Trichonephila clavipes]|nr:hypothetical protein TNCV_3461061 [Trichonephila clavipes]